MANEIMGLSDFNKVRTARFFDEMPHLIWISDPQGNVVYANKRCVDFTGTDVTDKNDGGWVNVIHPDDQQAVFAQWMESIQTGIPFNLEYRLRGGDKGYYRWFLGRAVPIHDDQKAVTEWFGTATDIHDRKLMEQELDKTHLQIQLAMDLVQLGTYDWNLVTGEVHWNANQARFLGYEPEEQVRSHEDFISRIHPEDRDRLTKELDRAGAARAATFESECRLVLPDTQKVLFVKLVARIYYGRDGKMERLLGVLDDITDEVMSKAALRNAQQAAESASLAKSQFLANMSHEIRTPLGVILGFAELALGSDVGASEIKHYLHSIRANGELLKGLIGELLDLAKIESGEMDLNKVEIDLPILIDDVVRSFRVDAGDRGIDLTVESSRVTGIPKLATDALRVRQVLTNLIGNAIKFTKRGAVRIRVDQEDIEGTFDKKITFVIEDTGIGVTEEQKSRLFKPFSQADSSTTRKFGGTGLGLVISKELARLLGGDVRLLKSEVDKGSVFEFHFLASVLPACAVSPSKGSRSGSKNRLHGVKVLLVEDVIDNQELFSKILQLVGAEVEIASNGEDGVSKALNGQHDVVLMDIQMPVLDGFDATKILRGKGFDRPIVALTAHALMPERERSLREGFNDYLTKPLDSERLIATVLKFT